MDDFFENKKRYLIWSALILLLVFLFLNFSFSYFNIPDSCYIKIKNPGLASNRSNVKKAIRFLKKSDRKAYDAFCRYADTIIESDCMGSDWHLNEEMRGHKSAGCYIKGSKTIYLNPLLTRPLPQEKISELIAKYSLMSEKFWTENKR